MTRSQPKINLSSSRDIPLDKLVLSQSNVRRIKAGVCIAELAEDIARRTLLQSLTVRPVLDAEGGETGLYEVPAGGRRFRALELLVRQKRLAKGAPIPCVIRTPGDRRGGQPGRERPARAAASARPIPRLPDPSGEGPVRGGDRGGLLRLGRRGAPALASGLGLAAAARRLRR